MTASIRKSARAALILMPLFLALANSSAEAQVVTADTVHVILKDNGNPVINDVVLWTTYTEVAPGMFSVLIYRTDDAGTVLIDEGFIWQMEPGVYQTFSFGTGGIGVMTWDAEKGNFRTVWDSGNIRRYSDTSPQ